MHATSGRVTVIAAPPARRFSARMSPPCTATMRWQIARPRPVPRGLVVKNGSKMRSMSRRRETRAGVGDLDAQELAETGSRCRVRQSPQDVEVGLHAGA